MDLLHQLETLATNLSSKSFRELAKAFEEELKQAAPLSGDERDELWKRYQQIWEQRKAYLDQRQVQAEKISAQLESTLEALSRAVESKDFPERAKSFQEELKRVNALTHDQRERLWNRLQELWAQRKRRNADRQSSSESAKRQYVNEIYSIDYKYDGAPILQSFSNYERVGEKVRAARQRLKSIGDNIKKNDALLPNHRRELHGLLDDIWHKVKQSEETTFSVHGERAGELYNEAYRAVESLPTREAGPILKATGAEVRSLYLDRNDRARYKSMFDDLWSKLNFKRDESQRDWRRRQEEGLEKLRAARDKAMNALERVRDNIRDNRSRLSDARSSEFAGRISSWISEGEEKERDIERSINDLEAKIRDAENRLRS